jgi:hypothetical protein
VTRTARRPSAAQASIVRAKKARPRAGFLLREPHPKGHGAAHQHRLARAHGLHDPLVGHGNHRLHPLPEGRHAALRIPHRGIGGGFQISRRAHRRGEGKAGALDRLLEIGAAMKVDLVAAPRERAAERNAGIDVAGRPDRGDDDMQDFASSEPGAFHLVPRIEGGWFRCQFFSARLCRAARRRHGAGRLGSACGAKRTFTKTSASVKCQNRKSESLDPCRAALIPRPW